jgi:hypothetical protein
MNSYSNVGVAHAELLPVTYLRTENLSRNNDLLLPSSLEFLVASSTSRESQSKSCAREREREGP